MEIRLEKPALNNFKAYGWQNEKPRLGFLKWKTMVDKWFSNLNLLPKSKEERTEVISEVIHFCCIQITKTF